MTNSKKTHNQRTNVMSEVLRCLRERNVVFTKADKSNNIIVLEREAYDRIALGAVRGSMKNQLWIR